MFNVQLLDEASGKEKYHFSYFNKFCGQYCIVKLPFVSKNIFNSIDQFEVKTESLILLCFIKIMNTRKKSSLIDS